MFVRLLAVRRLAVAGAVSVAATIGSTTDVGDTAPGFELPNANGPSQSLAELLERGPAVVVFYRAFW